MKTSSYLKSLLIENQRIDHPTHACWRSFFCCHVTIAAHALYKSCEQTCTQCAYARLHTVWNPSRLKLSNVLDIRLLVTDDKNLTRTCPHTRVFCL